MLGKSRVSDKLHFSSKWITKDFDKWVGLVLVLKIISQSLVRNPTICVRSGLKFRKFLYLIFPENNESFYTGVKIVDFENHESF